MGPAYFLTLARYNSWANRRLYEACGQLDAVELARPREAFFGSILATLNHLQVGDRAWMSRIEDRPDPEIVSLDQILHRDFPALSEARWELDRRILAAVERLTAAGIGEVLHYRDLAGISQSTPMSLVLGHLFNHQTHHRGQVHGLLSATAVAPPPLDLILFLREAA